MRALSQGVRRQAPRLESHHEYLPPKDLHLRGAFILLSFSLDFTLILL